MSLKNKGRIGQQLLAAGLITQEQLDDALAHQVETGGFLGDALVKLGYVRAQLVGEMLSATVGVPYVDLGSMELDPHAFDFIPEEYQRQNGLLPYKFDGEALYVAMSDPLNVVVVDNLRHITGHKIITTLALFEGIQDAFNRAFSLKSAAETVLKEIEESHLNDIEADISTDQLIGMAEDAPIVRLVNSIIAGAVNSKASDIHIEPQEKNVRVRYRIDGILYEQMTFAPQYHAAVVSRIKVISHLNISERRRPQDGRITFSSDGVHFDLRISTMHMVNGEKVVMRVLDKSTIRVPLERLGFQEDQLTVWNGFLMRPHGMVLVTGPTGSGKSTTLYASLNRINDIGRNIITIEDPVEYNLAGINQSQVNSKIGVNFATGLRAIVRQDPDVIMVGEIRDFETADISVQSALTGHLVFSTLHTNDAPGALIRLENMGVEKYLIASSVIGVIGQRLLRRICPECAEKDSPDADLLAVMGISAKQAAKANFRRGQGCSHCSGRGFSGRTAAYEVMPMTPRLRKGLREGADGTSLKELALADGMVTMQEMGIRKALAGETTLEEVCRVLTDEEQQSGSAPVEMKLAA